MSTDKVDARDVQRLIAYPCTHQCSRHHILRVTNGGAARDFVRRLLDSRYITDAALPDKEADARSHVHIGFTYRGLEAMEVNVKYLRVFQDKARAFAEGACIRAAQRLADTGESAAKWWEAGFGHRHAHLLLTMHAEDRADLDALSATLEGVGKGAVDGWKPAQDGEHLTRAKDYRTVHFGFRDLIAQPCIEGLHDKGLHRHAPGEFLLGYANDHGFNPWRLVDPPGTLDRWPPLTSKEREFFRNGSFAAFRKMEQDEAEWEASIKRWNKAHGDIGEEYIKAKIVGRWPDGRVVDRRDTGPPQGQPPAELDDFTFKEDPQGLGCPFGSHIRRMNPRGEGVVPARKRALIRRGMPYGPLFKDEPAKKRGLLGLFFCASLEDQFEHLLSQWGDAPPMGPPNKGSAKDPFMGSRTYRGETFDIPVTGEKPRQLDAFKPFVTTRGTLYAFFPGMAALSSIASGDVRK
jgi:deferrochelatase/peroxidase EfeB